MWILFFLFVAVCNAVGRGDEHLIPPPPLVTNRPYFDSSMDTIVKTHVNQTAELHCRVHSLGNNTVSWIQSKDIRILTVNRYTYASDMRHEIVHQDETNQWTLKIKSIKPSDEGLYECQISTKPLKSFSIRLIVKQPRLEVLGAPDLYVQRHSMINLTCIMHDVPIPPGNVFWFHNRKIISYCCSRGGVSHVVEKGPTTISYLLIQQATSSDSGIYSCAPPNMELKNITVHVLNGEFPAAMQANNSANAVQPMNVGFNTGFILDPSFVVFSTLFRTMWHVWNDIT